MRTRCSCEAYVLLFTLNTKHARAPESWSNTQLRYKICSIGNLWVGDIIFTTCTASMILESKGLRIKMINRSLTN